MAKIVEKGSEKEYRCEGCDKYFNFYGQAENHEKWECSKYKNLEKDPDQKEPKRVKLAANPLAGMRGKLLNDEKVVLVKHNQPSWGSKTVAWWGPMEVGAGDIFVGVFSGGANIPNREGDWHAGSFYLTNQRIIFEGTNKATNLIIDLKGIDSFAFKDLQGNERRVIGEGETHLFVSEEEGEVHQFALGVPEEAQEVQKQLVSCNQEVISQKAKHCEDVLDYKKAIRLWEKIGRHKDAKRIREIVMKGQGQTVIQGDYVDDRDTIVRDSVVNKSKIGGASSKLQELKDLKELLDSGAINDKDYEQMKNEIMGN